MRGHNICFHCEISKIIFKLSAIPLLSGALLVSKEVYLIAANSVDLN